MRNINRYPDQTKSYESGSNEELVSRLMSPQPRVIGIEGGPCGGKSTLTERVVSEAEQRGVPVYVLPEVATKHILRLAENGLSIAELAVNDREGYLAFQAAVLGDINERIIAAKQQFAGTDTLIISDRLSNRPYITPEEYVGLCHQLGYDTEEVMHGYVDKVIYLPSVSKVAPDLYEQFQLSNKVRYESLAEAQATCDRTLASVASHPELHIIADGYDFEAKMRRALNHVFSGDNEFEAKWFPASEAELIEFIEAKGANGEVLNTVDMVQTYHRLAGGTTYRLRSGTGSDGQEFYHFALKQHQEFGNKELRRIISEEEHWALSQELCVGHLFKRRYVIVDNWQIWHFDHLLARDGSSSWVVEAEVSDPAELSSLTHPIQLEDASDFKTEAYALGNVA